MPFAKEKIEEWKERAVPAVFDSSPLIYLTKIGLLSTVLKCYTASYTPPSVKYEVIDKGLEREKPDAYILDDYLKKEMITVRKPTDRDLYERLFTNPMVHQAEVEAICLAEELNAVLVMDDLKAVEIARMRDIPVEPSLTVILISYACGHITFERASSAYKELLTTQFRVKADIYERALELLEAVKQKK